MSIPFDSSLRRLSILWLFSLAAVALLALSSDVLFGSAVTRSEDYADIVNLAGRQRTLSQQIALYSALFVQADSDIGRATYARRLTQVLNTMKIEYELLIEDAVSDPDLRALYYDGDHAIVSLDEAYWDAALLLLEMPSDEISPVSPPYAYIHNNSQFLLARLDQAVRAILDDSIASASSLHQINNLRLLVVLALLIAQLLFVFRPAVARLRSRGNALEHEIGERKRAEAELRASEARFRLLVDAAPVGIFESDMNTDFTWVNTRWQEIVGMSHREATRSQWIKAIHPDDLETVLATTKRQQEAGEQVSLEYRVVRPDGKVVHVLIGAVAAFDAAGNQTGLIGTVLDVTQRKLAEERALTLEAERQRIRVLGEFIRDTSHDLRTPLTVIKSGLYFVRKLTDIARIHEKAEVIEQYVDYLNVVIDQLQEMAVLDTITDLTLTQMYISPLLRDIVADQSRGAESKTIYVELEPDLPSARAAPEKLIYAFRAVLENAVRYTPDGGTITVGAHRDGQFIVISVADNGIGIAAEHVPHVFERFFKVDKSRSVGGGAGLGLPIARRVIELHGGSMTLESTLGDGTTVRMTMMAAQP